MISLGPCGLPHRPWCAEAVRLYAEGNSALAIASKIRGSPGTVYKYLRAHGVPIRAQGPKHHQERPDILARYHAGESASQIAKTVSLTPEWIRQVIVRADGAYVAPPRANRGHRCNDVCALLVQQGGLDGLTLFGFAKAHGVSVCRVEYAGRQHGFLPGVGHRCRDLCRRVLAGLQAGTPPNRIGRTKSERNAIFNRLKTFHPDWPWLDGRRHRKTARTSPSERRITCGYCEWSTPDWRTTKTGIRKPGWTALVLHVEDHHHALSGEQMQLIVTGTDKAVGWTEEGA